MGTSFWAVVYHVSSIVIVTMTCWQLWRSQRPYQTLGLLLLYKTLGALIVIQIFQFSMVNQWLAERMSSSFTLFPFYTDWLWTTTFSLIIIWKMADLHQLFLSKTESEWLLTKLVYSNLSMLTLGLFAERAMGSLRLVLFSFAAGLLLYIFRLVWQDLRMIASKQSRTIATTYYVTIAFLSFAWISFPILWMLSPLGFALLSNSQSEFSIAFIHSVTKIGFFFCVWFGWKKMEREEGHEEERV